MRQPRHAHDHLPEVLAQHAAFNELDAGEQHRLLLDFRGADRPGAETHAADVKLVRARAGPRDMLPSIEKPARRSRHRVDGLRRDRDRSG